jgi:hypothetical protein
MFDWLFAQEIRIWIFIAVCVIAVFVVAVASLLHLTVETSAATALGLLASAEYGFFIGFVVFTMVLLGLYIYLGRAAKVVES